jgi:hypothetical protein
MKILISYELAGKREVEGPFEDFASLVRRARELQATGVRSINQVRQDIVCDFCSDSPAIWLFQICPGGVIGEFGIVDESGVQTQAHMDNDGQWIACEICKQLIELHDWASLHQRSYERLVAEAPDLPPMLAAISVKQAHSLFIRNWDGKRPVREQTDEEFLKGIQ